MSADAWPEPLVRIGELRIASVKEIGVSWHYFDEGTRNSDEHEVLAMIGRHVSVLSDCLDGTAANMILIVGRIPTDRGPIGPPGFSFTRRDAENNLERPRSVRELLLAAQRHLSTAFPD